MSDKVIRLLGEQEKNLLEYKSYDDMVAGVREELSKTETRIIQVRWYVGCQAYIITEGSRYGDRSVEEFAEAIGLRPSSVYEARKFYLTYSQEELKDRLLSRDFSYRRALLLSRCNEPVNREFLEDVAAEHNLTDDEIGELVKMFNQGVAVPMDPSLIKEFLNLQKTTRAAEEAEVEDGLSDPLEEVARRKDLQDDEDWDDDEEPIRVDPHNQKGVVRDVKDVCEQVNEACLALTRAVSRADSRVQVMSSLTGNHYSAAEQAFMIAAQSAQEAQMAIYTLNKSLMLANIPIRKK